MKCPFRKSKVTTARNDTGKGYPQDWITTEFFEKCIGEECAAYYVIRTCYPELEESDGCALCPRG